MLHTLIKTMASIAIIFAGCNQRRTVSDSQIDRAKHRVLIYASDFDGARNVPKILDINLMLKGLPPKDIRNRNLVAEVNLKELLDPWDNPYVAVIISEPDKEKFIGVYSAGPDGYSSTNGNDEDDINSWRGASQ